MATDTRGRCPYPGRYPPENSERRLRQQWDDFFLPRGRRTSPTRWRRVSSIAPLRSISRRILPFSTRRWSRKRMPRSADSTREPANGRLWSGFRDGRNVEPFGFTQEHGTRPACDDISEATLYAGLDGFARSLVAARRLLEHLED